MYSQEKLQKKIKEIVINVIQTDSDFSPNADLRQYGMNSINCISIIVRIEEEYNFEFLDEDLILENFITTENLVEYVRKRLIDKSSKI